MEIEQFSSKIHYECIVTSVDDADVTVEIDTKDNQSLMDRVIETTFDDAQITKPTGDHEPPRCGDVIEWVLLPNTIEEIDGIPVQQFATESLRLASRAPLVTDGDMTVARAAVRARRLKAEYERLSEGEKYGPDVHAWMDTGLIDAAQESGIHQMSISAHLKKLRGNGITQFRHILASGKHGNGLGTKGIQLVESLLTNDYGVEWKSKPEISDIAGYCRSLDEVPAKAVHYRINGGISVQDMIENLDETDDLFGLLLDFNTADNKILPANQQQELMESIRSRTAEFADAFATARAQL